MSMVARSGGGGVEGGTEGKGDWDMAIGASAEERVAVLAGVATIASPFEYGIAPTVWVRSRPTTVAILRPQRAREYGLGHCRASDGGANGRSR